MRSRWMAITFRTSSMSFCRWPAWDHRSFRDNNVLHRGHEHVAIENPRPLAANKSLLIVGVVAKQKQFDGKEVVVQIDHVPQRGCHGLEGHLPIQSKSRSDAIDQRREQLGLYMDHEVCVSGGAGNTVKIAGERSHRHVGDFEGVEPVDHRGRCFLGGHASSSNRRIKSSCSRRICRTRRSSASGNLARTPSAITAAASSNISRPASTLWAGDIRRAVRTRSQ